MLKLYGKSIRNIGDIRHLVSWLFDMSEPGTWQEHFYLWLLRAI